MRIRRAALHMWVAVSLAWGVAIGGIAVSGYMTEGFRDAVRLQQQAKDLRAVGIDPATVAWGGAIRIGNFVVPPVMRKAPTYWRREAPRYAGYAGAMPVLLLALMGTADFLAAMVVTAMRRRPAPVPRRPAAAPVPAAGADGMVDWLVAA